jgi:hypothetical protein
MQIKPLLLLLLLLLHRESLWWVTKKKMKKTTTNPDPLQSLHGKSGGNRRRGRKNKGSGILECDMTDAWEEAMMRAVGGRAACSEETYASGASQSSAPKKRPASDDVPARSSKKAHMSKLPAGAVVEAKHVGPVSAKATLK